MDSFEFVQIPVAIVLGFGISEILAGWGHQLRHRHEHPISGLQLLASGYVLMWAFRYLWIQWSSQPEVWDYAAYLLSVAPAVLIALAAHSIRFTTATCVWRWSCKPPWGWTGYIWYRPFNRCTGGTRWPVPPIGSPCLKRPWPEYPSW